MSSAEVRQLEAALRRSAELDVSVAAQAASVAAIEHAADRGLVDVAVGTMESPLGDLLIAVTARGLARVAYDPRRVMFDELAAMISPRVVEAPRVVDPVRHELEEYFAGDRRVFDLELDFALTSAFGRAVFEGAVQVPAGELVTYGELAVRIGNPRAARAVGNALGSNPIAIVVPCHRVVPSSGGVGKYTGGVWRKEILLDLEGTDMSGRA